MSLYRSPARRSVGAMVAIAVVALVAGGVAGYLIGAHGHSSPTVRDGIAHAQTTIRPAVDGIELVAVEYPIGVKDGKVAVPAQFEGARDQLATVREAFAKARPDLALLDAAGAARAAADLDRLQAKIAALAPTADVAALVTQIQTELRQLARLS